MRPSYVSGEVHEPDDITSHVGSPAASYVNHIVKSAAFCCTIARPHPFCAAPPHHMSVRSVIVVLAGGPNMRRESDLRPLAPPIEKSSVAWSASLKVK